MKRFSFFFFVLMTIGLIACSPMAKLAKAQTALLQDSALKGAHLGVAVYDPATGNYLYDYQSDHYFVPASNTKLFTCYAAMKYLGDSLVGLEYQNFTDTSINLIATGDPTFLHPDFPNQPVLDFLKNQKKIMYLSSRYWKDSVFGTGWAWDDYNSDYMPERSPFPILGNTSKLKLSSYEYEPIGYEYAGNQNLAVKLNWSIIPASFKEYIKDSFELPLPYAARFEVRNPDVKKLALLKFAVVRGRTNNNLSMQFDEKNSSFSTAEIPFVTNETATAIAILRSDYHIENIRKEEFFVYPDDPSFSPNEPGYIYKIYSQPTDSLLKPMMHRSDNFFAEQTLLMIQRTWMNDASTINHILNVNLKDLPQKPVWVDGCGLSRYNLFTPQDMVAVLLKIKNEFGLERIKNILPKGNTGTLTNYYQQIGPAIFAKTGSLSGVVALSGYLNCKSGKLLLFSILVNNHNSSGRAIRRAVEKFVMQVWEKN